MKIRIAGSIQDSLANGPGIRYVLFTQGCSKHCDGCHNKHTWSKEGGFLMEIDDIVNNIVLNPLISGVTISGGDPLEQPEAVYKLCKKIKEKSNLNIIVYTGYTVEEIRELNNEYIDKIIKEIDYLIDGKFVADKTNGALRYTGSNNQRIFNTKTMEVVCF